jgi:hypothetical protein
MEGAVMSDHVSDGWSARMGIPEHGRVSNEELYTRLSPVDLLPFTWEEQPRPSSSASPQRKLLTKSYSFNLYHGGNWQPNE